MVYLNKVFVCREDKKVLKTIEFRCSNTVETKNGRKVRCNKFLCEISERILIVCSGCGARFALEQESDGRFKMTKLAKLRINLKTKGA